MSTNTATETVNTNKVTFKKATTTRLRVKPSIFLRLLKSGLPSAEVAYRTGISQRGVQRHRARLVTVTA